MKHSLNQSRKERADNTCHVTIAIDNSIGQVPLLFDAHLAITSSHLSQEAKYIQESQFHFTCSTVVRNEFSVFPTSIQVFHKQYVQKYNNNAMLIPTFTSTLWAAHSRGYRIPGRKVLVIFKAASIAYLQPLRVVVFQHCLHIFDTASIDLKLDLCQAIFPISIPAIALSSLEYTCWSDSRG